MNRIFKEVKQIGDRLTIQQIKINKNNKNETYDVRIIGTNTREKLRQLGLWGTNCYNKFIPTQYLLSSKEDRLELLRGLMDTDGYFTICKCGNKLKKIAGFGVTSEQLVKDIKFLIYSLGGSTGRICKKQCKYKINGKQKVLNHYEYRFEIRMPKDISIFNCKRKKEREKSVKLKSKKMNTLDIAIKDIKGDFYNYVPEQLALIGNSTKKVYRIGDKVKVRCVAASKITSMIDFELVGDNDGNKE